MSVWKRGQVFCLFSFFFLQKWCLASSRVTLLLQHNALFTTCTFHYLNVSNDLSFRERFEVSNLRTSIYYYKPLGQIHTICNKSGPFLLLASCKISELMNDGSKMFQSKRHETEKRRVTFFMKHSGNRHCRLYICHGCRVFFMNANRCWPASAQRLGKFWDRCLWPKPSLT